MVAPPTPEKRKNSLRDRLRRRTRSKSVKKKRQSREAKAAEEHEQQQQQQATAEDSFLLTLQDSKNQNVSFLGMSSPTDEFQRMNGNLKNSSVLKNNSKRCFQNWASPLDAPAAAAAAPSTSRGKSHRRSSLTGATGNTSSTFQPPTMLNGQRSSFKPKRRSMDMMLSNVETTGKTKSSSKKASSSNTPEGHPDYTNRVIYATDKELMRQVSALGLEDPVFKTSQHARKNKKLFDDMKLQDLPADCRDMISVASDRTDEVPAFLKRPLQEEVTKKALPSPKSASVMTKTTASASHDSSNLSSSQEAPEATFVPPSGSFIVKSPGRYASKDSHKQAILRDLTKQTPDLPLDAMYGQVGSTRNVKSGMEHILTPKSSRRKKEMLPPKATSREMPTLEGIFSPAKKSGGKQARRDSMRSWEGDLDVVDQPAVAGKPPRPRVAA